MTLEAPIIDRKDFVTDERCSYCGKRLTSGVAWIVRERDGTERPAGEVCAASHAARPDILPDFTRGGPDAEPAPRRARLPLVSPRAVRVPSGLPDHGRRAAAITYLRLRQEKLCHCRGVAMPYLEHYRRLAATGKLEDRHYAELLHTMDIIERRAPLLSPENLQSVYAADAALEHARRHLPPRTEPFLSSLAEYLRSHLYLTPPQVSTYNAIVREHRAGRPIRPAALWEHTVRPPRPAEPHRGGSARPAPAPPARR